MFNIYFNKNTNKYLYIYTAFNLTHAYENYYLFILPKTIYCKIYCLIISVSVFI